MPVDSTSTDNPLNSLLSSTLPSFLFVSYLKQDGLTPGDIKHHRVQAVLYSHALPHTKLNFYRDQCHSVFSVPSINSSTISRILFLFHLNSYRFLSYMNPSTCSNLAKQVSLIQISLMLLDL